MTIQLHKSCDTLPIYNFYKIVEDANFNYLVVGYDDMVENDIKVNVADCGSNWSNILTEYGELTVNRKIIRSYEMQIEILYKDTLAQTGQKILDNYREFGDLEVLNLLSDFDFNFNEKKNIENQINMVIRKIKGLRNQVRILKAKYSNLFGNKETTEEKVNLIKNALSLEMSLDLGREINTRKTSVSKWVYMINIANEKSKEIERIKNK